MTNRIYLYPLGLRLWHWTNATLFLFLIWTGLGMHYAGSKTVIISFETSVALHNICGIALSVMYVGFLVGNLLSGNYKHYLPKFKGIIGRLARQAIYYLYGIFKGAPHPHHATEKQKFNQLQQITYLQIMYVLMPVLIISGWFLLFPEYAPDKVLGAGGVWPVAILHSAVGFFGCLFMFGHIYLATTGDTVLANFKGMLTGWHDKPSH
jgi:thiosulfate reductase cytochrome b subunit